LKAEGLVSELGRKRCWPERVRWADTYPLGRRLFYPRKKDPEGKGGSLKNAFLGTAIDLRIWGPLVEFTGREI